MGVDEYVRRPHHAGELLGPEVIDERQVVRQVQRRGPSPQPVLGLAGADQEEDALVIATSDIGQGLQRRFERRRVVELSGDENRPAQRRTCGARAGLFVFVVDARPDDVHALGVADALMDPRVLAEWDDGAASGPDSEVEAEAAQAGCSIFESLSAQ